MFLLSLDSRFVGVLPSVLATATMLHVIDQIEKSDGVEYKKQLLGVLKINKVSSNVWMFMCLFKEYLFI